MLTNEEVKEIINKIEVVSTLKLLVIERYIYDLKLKEVKINQPIDFMNEHLMNIAFEVVKNYYKENLKL